MPRLIEFENRRIEVPDDATDADVSQILSASAPPSLANAAATAQADLVQQPGVMEGRAAKDLATLEPKPAPSFMDRLKSVMADVPGAMSSAADTGAYLPRGIRRGMANIVGLPVDAVNAGLSVAGVPVSQKPFGGSKHLDDILGLNGVIPELRPATTVTERAFGRVGEEIGASAVPAAAAIRAGRMGVEAARELPVLARMFVEPAAINPGRFAAREGSTAFAAGSGAAAATEIARAAGAKEGGTAYNTVDILGALGGAGALGASRIVGKPIGDVAQAIFSRDKFSNQTVKENVVDRIINNSDTLPKTEGQPVDTTPIVEAIGRGSRVDETIPNFKDSLADRTGDSSLATLEYGRQSGPNAGDFVKRRTENTAAVDAAMDANAPQGSPAALRSELELERTRRLTDAGVNTANANDTFERATQGLQPAMTGEGRGANIRTALEGASEQARQILSAAWEPLNNSTARVDTGRLADRFDNVAGGLSVAERERFTPAQAEIPRRLATEDVDGVATPTTQPVREVTGLRSALTDASREAATAGRTNEARVINQHVEALDNYLERAVPAEFRADYDAARAATVDFNDRFTRPQTAIAQTLDRQEGLYRQPDSAVASKFVQADEGRINDFQALMREAGNDERVVTSVRDQILADVRDRGLLNNPQQLTEYLGRYNTVLSDPRFVGVRGELDNAAGLRRSLDDATANEQTLARELGTADRPGTSTVGKYLQYGDERAQDALKGVLASKNPAQSTDELLTFVNNAPEAVEGAKKAFWDLMQARSRSNGETTRTMDGRQPWLANRLQGFLDDPATRAVAERLWRDNPEHLGNVRQIAQELQGVDLRARGKANNTSGTAQSISNVLTPETLQSRFYAYKRGQTSLGFMLTALGSVAARRLVRGAQGEAMEKLLDRALLDPDLAAQLLKEHNPANRAALARTAKTYLGNEASTLTDILTEPEDPVKKAITTKGGDR